MSYESVDQLQKILTEKIFHYASDSKKAAGRALGTIVEIITFYLLKSWGLTNSISIERRIPEFGNPHITHNVEYSLHPIYAERTFVLPNDGKSITSHRLLKIWQSETGEHSFKKTNNTLLTQDRILRNACIIARDKRLVASILKMDDNEISVSIAQQSTMPFAIFECKRVGVEEGSKKGPQTIEKAKQGAYVAKTVSSLQKVRLETGELFGIIYQGQKVLYSEPYHDLLEKVINSDDPQLLKNFILTIGVVSNHGNWFTEENHNKELKVLAQSYDWLIFLTDPGITEFVEEVLLNPGDEYKNIQKAFNDSYGPTKKKNQFTKVRMHINADRELLEYFARNVDRIEKWFNVISPSNSSLQRLRNEIKTLQQKQWSEMLK